MIPEFNEVAQQLGVPVDAPAEELITVRLELIRFLLSEILRLLPFDSEQYLADNPDVRQAHETSNLSPLDHYVNVGYFEGRTPQVAVDTAWYLSQYSDVAMAYLTRQLGDIARHYWQTGRYEGRAANEGHLATLSRWNAALSRALPK